MPELTKFEELARRETSRSVRDKQEKEDKKLSESEIRNRIRDLDDALTIYASARKKLSESLISLREAINLYQEFIRKCQRSNSNRYAMVARRLKIKFILDTAMVASGKISSVINSSSRIQTMTSDDLHMQVVDPELLNG